MGERKHKVTSISGAPDTIRKRIYQAYENSLILLLNLALFCD